MLKRHAVLGVAVVALAVFVTSAAADPINAKKSLAFPAVCSNGQTLNVVVNGVGNFTAAHVIDSTSVFNPQILNVTSVFTPTGGTPITESGTSVKQNLHGDLVTCAFDTTQTLPNGTLHLSGTTTGVFSPASS